MFVMKTWVTHGPLVTSVSIQRVQEKRQPKCVCHTFLKKLLILMKVGT